MYSTINYRHGLLALLVAMLLAGTVWAQDDESRDDDASETTSGAEQADTTAAAEDAEAAEEEIDVDDGSYLDAEDDDFRPSEEISADRSITFPTDI